MKEQSNLIDIKKVNPRIQLDIRYATPNNFLGVAVYSMPLCYLHHEAAEALNKVHKDVEKLGLNLKVFDGYRPLPVQQLMWETIRDERYVSNPATNKGGPHTRGIAIDLTFIDAKGNELEMPSGFDEFTERSHYDYMGGSLEAIKNRALLRFLMEKHGFESIPSEWWHFHLPSWNDSKSYPSLAITFEELQDWKACTLC